MKDLGMVILSQTRSLTSNPELGLESILAILYMGVVMVSRAASPVGVWEYEGMWVWRNERMETYKYERMNMEVWKNGRMETWGYEWMKNEESVMDEDG